MIRKSKRELERVIEDMKRDTGVDYDGPDEIVIRNTLVETDHDHGDETPEVPDIRVWRDGRGEWHSEETN